MYGKQIFDDFRSDGDWTSNYTTLMQLIYNQLDWLSSDKQREFAKTALDEIQQHKKITYKSVMLIVSLLSQIELNKYKSEKVVKGLYV